MQRISFDQLWSFAQSIEPTAYDQSSALDPIGLLLYQKPLPNEYPAPGNGIAFGGTGGDFVTFCYLEVPQTALEDCPIIMVVPVNPDNRTIVVGENLHDFLCLGSELGYFFLEQYSYSPETFFELYGDSEKTWRRFEKEELEFDCEPDGKRAVRNKKRLLERLRNEFQLHGWNDLEKRMQNLQEKYLPQVSTYSWWDA